MNGSEIILAEVGGFLFLGAALAVTREALKKNWIKFTISASITPPDGRWPRKAFAEPEPAAEPAVPITESRPGRAA